MSKKNNEEFKVGMTGVQPETPEDVETETITVDVIEPTTPADQPAQEDAKPEEKKEKKEHFAKLKKFWNEGYTFKPKEVGKKIVKTVVLVGTGAMAATLIIGKTMANQGDDETLYLDDSGEGSDRDSGAALDCEYVGGDE